MLRRAMTLAETPRIERRQTAARRRGDRVELGRLRAAITAVATVDRERADRLEDRVRELEATARELAGRLDRIEGKA